MAGRPKHREVSHQLRADIAAGRYPAGARLPSESQLVRQFGISRPTAARALLDLQGEGLVERRAGSGTFVRGATVSNGSVRLLGLLVPGLGNTEIFELICGELASLARGHDFGLLWGASPVPGRDVDASPQHAEQICRTFIERKVSGVFFAPFELVRGQAHANRQLAESLRQAGIPVVLLDRDLVPFPGRSDFDLVGTDNVEGGFLLAEHLIKLGCRRLAFVAREDSAPTVDARIAGVREALVRCGLDPAPGWVRLGNPADPKFVRALTAGGPPDAFVCANDLTAARLLRSLETAGLRIPRDVRVVGFDDARSAALLGVPLTTMHQPCQAIAQTAFRAMLERAAEPTLPSRHLSMSARLVVRESCGAYLPRARTR